MPVALPFPATENRKRKRAAPRRVRLFLFRRAAALLVPFLLLDVFLDHPGDRIDPDWLRLAGVHTGSQCGLHILQNSGDLGVQVVVLCHQDVQFRQVYLNRRLDRRFPFDGAQPAPAAASR